MVAKVKFAITHEETRFQLNGALLKVQPDEDGDGGHRRPSHGADQFPAGQQRQGEEAPI